MKRSTKSKVYEATGRIVVFLTGNILVGLALGQVGVYILNNCLTTIR